MNFTTRIGAVAALLSAATSTLGAKVLRHALNTTVPVTYYDTTVGLGHCGNQNTAEDMILAINYAQFDMSLCGNLVEITCSNGNTATAGLQDSCDQSWGTCHDHSGLDTTKALFTLLGGDPVAGGHLDCTFNLYDQEYSPGVTPTGEPVATGDGQTISSVTTKTAAVSSAAVSSPPAQSEPSTLSQQAEPSQSEGSLLDGILGTNAKVNQDDSPAASSTTAETSPPSDSPAVGTDGCEGGAIQCGADGTTWSMCTNGSWQDMGTVSDGTLCKDGSVGWDPSSPGAPSGGASAGSKARMVRRHRRAHH